MEQIFSNDPPPQTPDEWPAAERSLGPEPASPRPAGVGSVVSAPSGFDAYAALTRAIGADTALAFGGRLPTIPQAMQAHYEDLAQANLSRHPDAPVALDAAYTQLRRHWGPTLANGEHAVGRRPPESEYGLPGVSLLGNAAWMREQMAAAANVLGYEGDPGLLRIRPATGREGPGGKLAYHVGVVDDDGGFTAFTEGGAPALWAPDWAASPARLRWLHACADQKQPPHDPPPEGQETPQKTAPPGTGADQPPDFDGEGSAHFGVQGEAGVGPLQASLASGVIGDTQGHGDVFFTWAFNGVNVRKLFSKDILGEVLIDKTGRVKLGGLGWDVGPQFGVNNGLVADYRGDSVQYSIGGHHLGGVTFDYSQQQTDRGKTIHDVSVSPGAGEGFEFTVSDTHTVLGSDIVKKIADAIDPLLNPPHAKPPPSRRPPATPPPPGHKKLPGEAPWYDNTNPYQLGLEFLKGGHDHWFGQGALMTKILRQDDHFTKIRQSVAANPPRVGEWVNADYSLGGPGGVVRYGTQYGAIPTNGRVGNLAVAYLGSYNLRYRIISIDKSGKAVIEFEAHNTSDLVSATHPPILGYTPWWRRNIEPTIGRIARHGLGGSGAMRPTHQTFQWTETVQLKRPPSDATPKGQGGKQRPGG